MLSACRNSGCARRLLEITIHRDQGVKSSLGASQQLAVLDASPAYPDDCIDLVTLDFRREVDWNVLVKQNAHG